jgi:hypothetical protein
MTSLQDREQSIERVLRERLRTRAAERLDSCIDAETLAAWIDGALSARERKAAEAHAANCARCQALAAAVIKVSPRPPTASWWRAPLITWLAPLTATAAAVAVWAIVADRSPIQKPEPASAAGALASARQEPPAQAPAEPPAPKTSTEPSRPASPARQVEGRAAPPSLKAAREDRQAEKEDLQKRAAPVAADSAAARAGSRDRTVPPPSAATAAAAPAAQAASPAAPTLPAGGPPAAPVDAVAERPSPQPAAAAAAAENATAETTQLKSALQGDARASGVTARRAAAFSSPLRGGDTTIASPDPAVRWRILGTGGLQRSIDGGASWQLQQPGAPAPLVAGAAPASTICWVVGRNGTVMLSTDGRSWRRVMFPEAADLIAVRAVDAMNATVTTADGRTFTTADGGRSWVR